MFSLFKKAKFAAPYRDNFSLIAQNVALYYLTIKETPLGQRLGHDQLLFATGYLDTIVYQIDGTMNCKSIATSIAYGRIGAVSLGFYTRHHRGTFERKANDELVGFTMQLSAQIFDASDTKVDYRRIVDAVIDKKSVIEKVVEDVLSVGTNHPMYAEIHNRVYSWLRDSKNVGMVLSFNVQDYYS